MTVVNRRQRGNSVSDAPTRSDEAIDGAIYSTAELTITGGGALDVTGSFAHAIVSEESLHVDGGLLTIDSVEDALKADNDTELGSGQLTITDGRSRSPPATMRSPPSN